MTDETNCLKIPAELGDGKRYQLEIYADGDTHFAIADLELVVTSDGAGGAINLKIVSNEHLVDCSEIIS